MASRIPGFSNYEPTKISDIIAANKDRSYSVKVVKTYAQVHEDISRLIKDDPRFKALSELSNKKKNIDSLEFIEETAREKLDMYLPNEKVYLDKGM